MSLRTRDILEQRHTSTTAMAPTTDNHLLHPQGDGRMACRGRHSANDHHEKDSEGNVIETDGGQKRPAGQEGTGRPGRSGWLQPDGRLRDGCRVIKAPQVIPRRMPTPESAANCRAGRPILVRIAHRAAAVAVITGYRPAERRRRRPDGPGGPSIWWRRCPKNISLAGFRRGFAVVAVPFSRKF